MEANNILPPEGELIDFDYETAKSSRIKIIGVGGGGCNAVTHMYKEGINDVGFVIANTDKPALDKSPVPNKLILGMKITGGRGTGNSPAKGEECALSSEQEIRKLFDDETDMVFVAAGMGGGTGTGSSPVVAQISKEMNKLTVGIVTIPYHLEMGDKIMQALDGVEKLSKNVDALIVVNNEKLLEAFPKQGMFKSFKEADNTLLMAAKSISDIITKDDYINIDFNDVNTTLREGGIAVISYGEAAGEKRITKAIEIATTSPLLNNNNLYDAKKVLMVINCSEEHEVQTDEFKTEVGDFMRRFKNNIGVIWGIGVDNDLDEKVRITVLASGFTLDNMPEMNEKWRTDYMNMTDEERQNFDAIRRSKEREEKNRITLITRYYGQKAVVEILGQAEPKPYIFKQEELDDNKIIEEVLNTPAYRRRS
ncbi:MAG: cell division protein FtsZ [Dysgonamonadaceae bacterium]|jgi:cell division protein FtsZ|nr:cell division protein FtsZ [Dysgonamonadaceae bacterium]